MGNPRLPYQIPTKSSSPIPQEVLASSASWLSYKFSVHQHTDSWNAVPGLYIFVGLEKDAQGILRMAAPVCW